MTKQKRDRPRRKPVVFTSRHMRGWVAGTACFSAGVFTILSAGLLLNSVLAGSASVHVDVPTLWGTVASVALAYLSSRRGGVEFRVRLGKLKLMIYARSNRELPAKNAQEAWRLDIDDPGRPIPRPVKPHGAKSGKNLR